MIAIPVQSPKYGEKLFFIDGEDFEKVTKYKWHVAHKKDKKYYVNATANGVRYYFGCYNNIDEAVKAYEDNINKYHKEFSRLI